MNVKSNKHLHDIRTLSDRVSNAEKPQRKFTRLAILELEKVRRNKEKRRATEQLMRLEKRLAEIEYEQARLIGAVYKVHPAGCEPAIRAPHADKFTQKRPADTPQENGNRADFKITY